MSAAPYRNRPLTALRALRVLANDPDDLPKVFTVIEALPGRAPQRMLKQMRSVDTGRRLLATRPDLRARLADREALRALEPGTLGRAYLEFVERAGISADGIVAASEAGAEGNDDAPDDLVWVGDRMRDTHDLWHVVTGYGADLVGEAALLSFTFAQTKHPGIGFVASLAILRAVPGARASMTDGYRRGRRAVWLPAVPWEELLDRPLDEVRTRLRIEPLRPYAPVTSDALREAGHLSPRAA